MSFLRHPFWRNPLAGIAPDAPFWVIGDIHGRVDLLERLLPRLGDAPLVFVGDYVDRGPSSRAVIALLRGLGTQATCLMGNHEAMLLSFLDDPLAARAWLRHGGLATLASYGLRGVSAFGDAEALVAARDALRAAFSTGEEAFLCDLPLVHQRGNVTVCHAGMDPARSVAKQHPQHLLWGASSLPKRPRADGIWVAHGHVVVERAYARAGRINVDTGAWFSDRLSAALISPGRVEFLAQEGAKCPPV